MASQSRAFGVEPGYAPYRLRQARYQALGEDVARLCRHRTGRVDLLDVGVGKGVSRRYTEVHPGTDTINYHAVDLYSRGLERVYKHSDWTHYRLDLEAGLGQLGDCRFDIVICEQVLEHLHNSVAAMRELSRVLKPGGSMFLGVPIFPHGLHLIRKHLVPAVDRITGHKPRPHVQAFSKRSFVKLVKQHCDVEVQQVRGFRIISGGVLRPLEHYRWWWRLNRRIGTLVPGACIEIQIVAHKPDAAAVSSPSDQQAA